jgi:hypothetical protein
LFSGHGQTPHDHANIRESGDTTVKLFGSVYEGFISCCNDTEHSKSVRTMSKNTDRMKLKKGTTK